LTLKIRKTFTITNQNLPFNLDHGDPRQEEQLSRGDHYNTTTMTSKPGSSTAGLFETCFAQGLDFSELAPDDPAKKSASSLSTTTSFAARLLQQKAHEALERQRQEQEEVVMRQVIQKRSQELQQAVAQGSIKCNSDSRKNEESTGTRPNDTMDLNDALVSMHRHDDAATTPTISNSSSRRKFRRQDKQQQQHQLVKMSASSHRAPPQQQRPRHHGSSLVVVKKKKGHVAKTGGDHRKAVAVAVAVTKKSKRAKY
jgi:hypothetical protein